MSEFLAGAGRNGRAGGLGRRGWPAIAASLLLLVMNITSLPGSAQREEVVTLFESRRVGIAVPPGFAYTRDQDRSGLVHVQLLAAAQQVSLDLLFVPDADGQAGTARARRERMVELFNDYVEGSVEKAMRFEELEPRRGAGTYCVFTDVNLVGKADLPPNEYLHLTAGVKSWPGVMVVIRLFSNDTKSPGYQAALRLLRESVEERPVPLR